MPTKVDHLETAGRVALATQGAIYVVVGILAVQVAAGHQAEASQRGALEAVAEQPLGTVLVAVLAAGLLAHAGWRAALVVRGEPGGEDHSSLASRVANLGRSLLYLALAAAAGSILRGSGPSGEGSGGASGGGSTEEASTAVVLALPAGEWLVLAVAAGLAGAAAWNARRAVTRSFLDKLDCSGLDERAQRLVEVLGIAGYLARGAVYGLTAWFLYAAARQHDADETETLDGALKRLADAPYGPPLLWFVAIGLVTFGLSRLVDARLRKRSELTWA